MLDNWFSGLEVLVWALWGGGKRATEVYQTNVGLDIRVPVSQGDPSSGSPSCAARPPGNRKLATGMKQLFSVFPAPRAYVLVPVRFSFCELVSSASA